MKPTLTHLKILATIAVIVLVAAACGAGDDTVSTTPNQVPSDPGDNAQTDDPSNGGPAEEPIDSDLPAPTPVAPPDGRLIGSTNVGGDIVDPKPTSIDSIAILESYPEQIAVEFTAGDAACTAATAQAFGTDMDVIITLEVGITTDALSRSCLAGQFPQSIIIALDEGLDGRDVVLAEVAKAAPDEPIAEPEAQPFAAKIIGLGEANAEEAVANEGLTWRVVARDGEDFPVTLEYLEERINVSIVDGVVVDATTG